MAARLASRFYVFYPFKILDVNHADTNYHDHDISAFVPPECVAVLIRGNRMSGSGNLGCHPFDNVDYSINVCNQTQNNASVVPIKNQNLSLKQSVANDDFDVILFGYWAYKRIR